MTEAKDFVLQGRQREGGKVEDLRVIYASELV